MHTWLMSGNERVIKPIRITHDINLIAWVHFNATTQYKENSELGSKKGLSKSTGLFLSVACIKKKIVCTAIGVTINFICLDSRSRLLERKKEEAVKVVRSPEIVIALLLDRSWKL